MEKKQVLLLDMHGVIIKESKGYSIPYTFEHFDRKNMTGSQGHFGRTVYLQKRIFDYAIGHIQCSPQECIFVDNSVQNLNAAQSAGIKTVLFNRDHEAYSGNVVYSFPELDSILKNGHGTLWDYFW